MSESFAAEHGRLLAETRSLLESMRAGGPPPGREEPLPEGVGESAGGRIRVKAVAGGRIEGIELDPRAMRMASQELADEMVAAVNAALDDLRAKAMTAMPEVADPAALNERVREIQDQGTRQMELISRSIADVMDKISGAAR